MTQPMPPELMQMLAGGGGGGQDPGGAPPGGMDPGMDPGQPPEQIDTPGGHPDAQGQGGDEAGAVDLLKQMIDLAQQYMQVEPDDVDKATMAKVLAQLQTYLAKNQQEMEAAMGTSPALKGLSRMSRGG